MDNISTLMMGLIHWIPLHIKHGPEVCENCHKKWGGAPDQVEWLHFHSLLQILGAEKDFHAQSKLFPRTGGCTGWSVLSEKENGLY